MSLKLTPDDGDGATNMCDHIISHQDKNLPLVLELWIIFPGHFPNYEEDAGVALQQLQELFQADSPYLERVESIKIHGLKMDSEAVKELVKVILATSPHLFFLEFYGCHLTDQVSLMK